MTRPTYNSSTVRNGLYAVAEYVSQPLGLLLTAPYLLRHMGAAQFGVWVLASAAVNSGNLFSSGFGDAAVKYASMYRGRSDALGVSRIVRGMLSINLSLGGVLAFVLWLLAPSIAQHVPRLDTAAQLSCLTSLRIGSLLVIVRCVESVFSGTLRAFELYNLPTRISICSRITSLIAALGFVAYGRGVVAITLATLCISATSVIALGIAVRRVAGKILFLPSIHRETLSLIASFGCFSWMSAISAIAFGQMDRFIIGLFLGAPAVAAYALCAQAAQSIHGIAGAGFHALFPHLSSRFETKSLSEFRLTIWNALKLNCLLAFSLGIPVIVFSRPILSAWMGSEFARRQWPIFSILAGAFTLFALNVTAHYTLLAAGRVRLVTALNLVAGVAMLLLMLLLTPRFGLLGTACARFVAGPVTCILYFPLYRLMHSSSSQPAGALPEFAAWENGA